MKWHLLLFVSHRGKKTLPSCTLTSGRISADAIYSACWTSSQTGKVKEPWPPLSALTSCFQCFRSCRTWDDRVKNKIKGLTETLVSKGLQAQSVFAIHVPQAQCVVVLRMQYRCLVLWWPPYIYPKEKKKTNNAIWKEIQLWINQITTAMSRLCPRYIIKKRKEQMLTLALWGGRRHEISVRSWAGAALWLPTLE